jgi:hypothetical protein
VFSLKHPLQSIKNTFKECGYSQSGMMVKIQEDAKNDDGKDYKPLEHITQHNKYNRNDQQHYPADMYRNQFIVRLINIV